MTAKTLCEHLADYVIDIDSKSIPADVVNKTKSVFLHDLAVAFAGASTEQGRSAIDFVEYRSGVATVIGQPFKAHSIDAALANSVMVRSLRMEDTMLPSFIHAGAFLVPAAMALGEQYRATGEEIIAGLVIAYDVIGRLVGSLWSWEHANRNSSHLFGAFGVAALAARLMRLDRKHTAGAIAHAANLGTMVTYGFQDFQYGIVARNGVLAANLAKCGAPFPRDAIEGPYGFYETQLDGARPTDQEIIRKADGQFDIMTTVLKPHPCTAINLVPIEIFRQLLCDHHLTNDDIREVKVWRSPEVTRVPNIHEKGPFLTPSDGLYVAPSSLPFALGTLVVDGEITPERFSNANNPLINAVSERVSFECRSDFSLLDHEVEITTNSGEKHRATGSMNVLPLPDSSKILNTFGRDIVGSTKILRLQEHIDHLDTSPDIFAITKCLA